MPNERDPRALLQSIPLGIEHSVQTAFVKREEGGGDGRSVCPESPGLHAGRNG